VSTSDITYFQTEITHIAQGDDVGFAPDPSLSAADNEKARKAFEQNRAALVGALAGYVTSGGNAVNVAQGSSIARGAVTWNRQLHRVEAQYLAELTKDLSAEERHRYQAAACFLVKCAAGVPTDDPQYAALVALQSEGGQYGAERAALQSATVTIDQSYSVLGVGFGDAAAQVKLFEYTYTDFWGFGDDFNDGLSANREPLDRVAGGASGVIGAGEAVGAVAGGAGLCAAGVASVAGTVAGCGGGAYLATTGAEDGLNRSISGFNELLGPYTSTAGADVIASFDPTWTGGGTYSNALASRFTGDLVGLAIGAAGGTIIHRIINGGSVNPFAGVLNGKSGLPEGGVGASRADDILPDTVYRGDARAPDEIFDQGFQPKDPSANVDLEEYVNTTPSPDSQYVSTTSDPDVATDFATQYGTQNGNVYDIDTPPNGIDIDNRLGNSALYDEAEITIPDGSGVLGCSIRGCQPVNPDGSPSAPYIGNPNYTGGN